jgi:hypothetical protein
MINNFNNNDNNEFNYNLDKILNNNYSNNWNLQNILLII